MHTAIALPSLDEQIKALSSDALYEIVNGEVRVAEPMGALGSTFAAVLTFRMNEFALPRRLGLAIIEGLYQLRQGLERRPDVSFIPAAQWPANLRPDEDPRSFQTVPSLAVEVVSPGYTSTEIEDKRLEYFDAGVKMVWVVHPVPRTIYVYASRYDCHLVTANGALDGGAAIPGFWVKVADIFACMFPTNGMNPQEE